MLILLRRRSERHLRDNICDYLIRWQARGHGVFVDIRHPNPNSPGREGAKSLTPGAPDILVFRGTTFIRWDDSEFPGFIEALALELKVSNRSQSPEQREWAERFEAQGGIYRVLRSETDLDGIFAELGWPSVQKPRHD